MKKLMILCLLLAFAGCGKKEETMVSPEPAASTPPVQTAASVPVPASTEEPERLSGYFRDQLNETQQTVYDRVLEASQLYTDTVEIPETAYTDVMRAVSALGQDHPEFWWLHNYTMTQIQDAEGPVVGIELTLLGAAEDPEAVSERIADAADIILAEAEQYISAYDRLRYYYEALAERTVYDESAENSQDIRSIFLDHRGVCAGYAGAMKYLCDRSGIPCLYVTGEASDAYGNTDYHTWNCVRLDGDWYWVDPTWAEITTVDPQTGIETEYSDRLNHFDLCFDDSELYLRHRLFTDDRTEDPSGYRIAFTYPVCTEETYEYCVLNGCRFDTYDREAVSTSLRTQYERTAGTDICLQFGTKEQYDAAVDDLLQGDFPYINEVFRPYRDDFTGYSCIFSDDHYGFMLYVQ